MSPVFRLLGIVPRKIALFMTAFFRRREYRGDGAQALPRRLIPA
ncbi:hypothetical protein C4K25_2190 [Pseudomonas chlororaphis]|nr:hypothetical protein C4K25_2190 [Pseudomonas chlororaphis]